MNTFTRGGTTYYTCEIFNVNKGVTQLQRDHMIMVEEIARALGLPVECEDGNGLFTYTFFETAEEALCFKLKYL